MMNSFSQPSVHIKPPQSMKPSPISPPQNPNLLTFSPQPPISTHTKKQYINNPEFRQHVNPPHQNTFNEYHRPVPTQQNHNIIQHSTINSNQKFSHNQIRRGQKNERPQIMRSNAVQREVYTEKPGRQSRIEYVPYQTHYTDYQFQEVLTTMWVPVQKKNINYYTIEHVTDFVPKEIQDYRIEVVPEEKVKYNLQYVPVQRSIVHYPKGDQVIDEKVYKSLLEKRQNVVSIEEPIKREIQKSQYLQQSRRTNYVTSDDYTPLFMQKQGDNYYSSGVGQIKPNNFDRNESQLHNY